MVTSYAVNVGPIERLVLGKTVMGMTRQTGKFA